MCHNYNSYIATSRQLITLHTFSLQLYTGKPSAMHIINHRRVLYRNTDGVYRRIYDAPDFRYSTVVDCRLAITSEGRLYDVDYDTYLDIEISNFCSVVVTNIQRKFNDYYRPEFFALTDDGNLYQGYIGDYDSIIYSWTLIKSNVKFIMRGIISGNETNVTCGGNVELLTGISLSHDSILVYNQETDLYSMIQVRGTLIGCAMLKVKDDIHVIIAERIEGQFELRQYSMLSRMSTEYINSRLIQFDWECKWIDIVSIYDRPYLLNEKGEIEYLFNDSYGIEINLPTTIFGNPVMSKNPRTAMSVKTVKIVEID